MPDASALAQRLAKTHDLDLSTLSGSGANGAVTARDVLEHLNQTESGVAGDSESPVQETETAMNPAVEPFAEHAARATQGAIPEAAEADASQNSAPVDSGAPPTPRWMFWRR